MSAASNPATQTDAPTADVERRELRALEQKAHEPSMEEILASIRRIIADDKALPISRNALTTNLAEKSQHLAAVQHLAAAQQSVNADAVEQKKDVPSTPVVPAMEPQSPAAIILTELQQAVPTPTPVNSDPIDPDKDEADFIVDLAKMPEALAPFMPVHPHAGMQVSRQEGAKSFSSILSSLNESKTGIVPNVKADEALASPLTDASVASSFEALSKSIMLDNAALIEDLTREMLRPMLKTWLDDNLPVMVEKLVRAEIERVARGGRG